MTTLDSLSNHRLHLLEQVKENILAAQDKQKRTYDIKHANPTCFHVSCSCLYIDIMSIFILTLKVGVSVLKKDFRRKKRKGGKIDPQWLGPYEITADLGKGFYALSDLESAEIVIKRVNGAHLKLYHDPLSSESVVDLSQYVSILYITYTSLCTMIILHRNVPS